MTDTPAINMRKGLCPKCGRWVELTKAGLLRSHHPDGVKCGGARPASKLHLKVKEVRFSVRKLP